MTFVLHVHTLPWVSGSGINTFLSMKLLDASRFRTALACAPGGRLETLVRESGFDFFPLRFMKAEVSPLDDLRAVLELRSLYKKIRPDVVHTHNSKAGFVGRLAARLSTHACRGPKVVHTVHGFSFHERESLARRRLFKTLERAAFRWADRTVAISEELAEWGARERIGRRSDYEILWSGIEIERFVRGNRTEGRRILGVPETATIIGLVAKLWEGKGHSFLLETAAPLLSEKIKIVFVGEGPLHRQLGEQARTLGIEEHVIFAGFHGAMEHVTAALDVSVLPSEFEGMGRVLLEAQAAGVPVIANNVGGISDVVGAAGILVSPNDQPAWRAALSRLIDDPALRAQMGRDGRQFVTEKFSAETMVRGLERIYEDVLK